MYRKRRSLLTMSAGLKLRRSLALQTAILGALLLAKAVKCWQAQEVWGLEMQPAPTKA